MKADPEPTTLRWHCPACDVRTTMEMQATSRERVAIEAKWTPCPRCWTPMKNTSTSVRIGGTHQ
jgi:hypothetical protein